MAHERDDTTDSVQGEDPSDTTAPEPAPPERPEGAATPPPPGPATAPSAAEPTGGAPTAPMAVEPAMGRRPRTSLLTWGTVALVLVIVIVLVVIKITGSSSVSTSSSTTTPSAAPSAVVQGVTGIPRSVYDAVGITSPVAAVTPPTLLHGQAPIDRHGKPEVVFVGNEFCPYCAAERWALIAALSRFGTFTGLDATQSGSNEAFSGTPTFTFVDARYSSKYIAAKLLEHYGDQKNGAGTGYAVLERIPGGVRTLMSKYDRATVSARRGLLPFVDIDNRGVVRGGNFSPSILQQLSSSEIATALHDAKDPATQAIVASANYLTAVVCSVDDQQPVSVCASTAVTTAASALGLGS